MALFDRVSKEQLNKKLMNAVGSYEPRTSQRKKERKEKNAKKKKNDCCYKERRRNMKNFIRIRVLILVVNIYSNSYKRQVSFSSRRNNFL